MLNEPWSHHNKPCSFLLKGPCIPRRPPKEAFQVRTSWWSDWNISSFQTLGKNTKNRSSCLKFFVVAVWIYICLDIKYLRIWITKSVWKNSVKMGFVAVLLVDLTELSSSKKHGNFYFIQLIIIFQLFQVVQLMDVIMLFHLICYMPCFSNFRFWCTGCIAPFSALYCLFSGRSLTNLLL